MIDLHDIKTERLLLRSLKYGDAPEIFFLRSDSRVVKYLDHPRANNIQDAEAFINKILSGIGSNESFYWGICLSPSDKLIGTICLWNLTNDGCAEIGYVLHPQFQKMGIMKEAMETVIHFAMEKLRLEKLVAEVHSDNDSSIKLLKKCGFSYVVSHEQMETWNKLSI